ncbi:allergen Tha p 1-like isoform X2 [Cydia splendana]|uniref:allergen Tha p 1-like isoform X2 n=1 Tax=Cydia splendana TaxID=1100963 RepID=UPI00300D9FDE
MLPTGRPYRTSSAEDFERLFAIDVQTLLEDEDEWKFLFECLMDTKPCGQYYNVKDTLPKLVQSQCGGCTPEQKEKFEKTLKQFLERYPADYTELSNKLLPKPA